MTHDISIQAQDLRARLDAAWSEYRTFMDASPPPDDAKAFGARHTAAKGALGHMEALIKLTRWAEAGAMEAATGEDAARLLSQARAALDAWGEGESDDASDDATEEAEDG